VVEAGYRTRDAIRSIVERSDLDRFTDRILDSFWDRPEYRRFRPPRDDVRAWVRWNVDLVVRWLVDDVRPTQEDLERFRERARKLAGEGMPADVVPANFRHGARAAWAGLLEAAHEDERLALLESADLLFEFVDRVSQVFSDTYESSRPAVLASEEERRAAELLERLCSEDALVGEDHQLAERVGFELRAPYRPFVVAAPSLSVQHHATLAGRFRAGRVLATAEGRRVAGVAHERISWRELGLEPRGAFAQGDAAPRAELADALDDLRTLVNVAIRQGRSGAVSVEDHLPELLLQRSPRLTARLRDRVYGRLASRDPELARTLDVLIEHDFDRGATAAALPVHRNTLSNRINRIRAVTGLDVDEAYGHGLVWLAWLDRNGAA
jgi:hypothetical protein